VNPHGNDWTWNNPSIFKLTDGKEQEYHCALINGVYRPTGIGELDGIQIFAPENSHKGMTLMPTLLAGTRR
jgi:hypothetical protein